MFLLDTVAISETQKPAMHPAIETFYASTNSDALRLSVVSIGEMHFGLNLMPPGKRRDALQEWIAGVEAAFEGQILGVDTLLGREWGFLRADVQKRGFTLAYNDLLIAATALHYDLTVVTRNVKDFVPTGCKVLNPWSDAV